MRRPYVLFLFLLALLSALDCGAVATDSLRQLINREKAPVQKAELLLQLARAYGRGEPALALNALQEAGKITTAHRIDTTAIEVLLAYATFYEVGGSADSTIFYANQAIKRSQAGKYKEIEARAQNFAGTGWLAKLNFAQAQQHFLHAIRLYEELGSQLAVGNLKVNFGYLFQQKGDTTTALRYYREAEVIFKTLKNEDRLAQVYNNFGILYGESGDVEPCLHYLLLSTRIREQLGNKQDLPNNYLNLGGVYLIKKDYAQSRYYLKKAMDLFTSLGNDRGTASCLSNLGVLEESTGNFKGAIDIYEQALVLARRSQDYGNIETQMINISNAYDSMQDFKNAYIWDEKLIALRDTLYQRNQIKAIAEIQAKYETAEKEKKIALLNNQNLVQKGAIQRRNIFIGVGSLLVLVLGIAAFQYYKRYKLRQETLLQEEIIIQQDLASRGIIEAEERERKRIASDLHDGIGQLFSAVRMNMNSIRHNITFGDKDTELSFEKTLDMVDESCKEVRSISHQMMPNTLLKFGLASAVRDFISKIDTRQLKVNLDIHGLNERLDANIETVLYRVLQETVNNVIKHAGASQLDIQLIKEEGAVTAMIEDNGRGFDMTTMEQAEGIGLKNMRNRVEYLKGTVEFDSTPGRGTVVSVWVPVQES